jgi:AraC family transcriptional regulator, regulatory protein of adaptative response / DNA-3-methyladenine glycosylase II
VDVLPGLSRSALDRARRSRDPRFDGRFYVAVTSTRIYCRPVCPVPSPKLDHIRYYGSAAAAAEAGYRPCLRCRPEAAPGTPAWHGTSTIVRRALTLIQDGALDDTSVTDLAARVGVGPRHLHRLFVQHLGAAPLTVALTRRLQFAKRLLDESDLPMTEVALAAGFGSLRRFNAAFRTTYARTPRDIRGRRRTGPHQEGVNTVALRLAFRPPYDWGQVRDFLGARALPGVERVDADGYTRALGEQARDAMIVSVRPRAGEHALELQVEGASPCELFSVAAQARHAFDLGADPALISRALASDPLLRPLVRRRPGLRIPGAWNPFECAVRAVLGQQVSVAAARTLAGRLVERAGSRLGSSSRGLTHLFPTPSALARANLDGLGLTGGRVRALRELSRAVAEGRLDLAGPTQLVTAGLASLPGVGAWTAQYVALRGCGEPDAFPDGDLVLRRAAGGRGRPLSVRELDARAEAWRPWRGYAALHLWRQASDAGGAPKRR